MYITKLKNQTVFKIFRGKSCSYGLLTALLQVTTFLHFIRISFKNVSMISKYKNIFWFPPLVFTLKVTHGWQCALHVAFLYNNPWKSSTSVHRVSSLIFFHCKAMTQGSLSLISGHPGDFQSFPIANDIAASNILTHVDSHRCRQNCRIDFW